MIVYQLTFANGKSYIGQTVRPLTERMAEHRKSSNRLPVARAWRRYGDPQSEVIATCSSMEELLAAEVAAISSHKTVRPGGYNLAPGGQSSPTLNPEVAKRVSETLKGRVFSAETRAKMSAAAKGRQRHQRSPETKAKIAQSAKQYWAGASTTSVAERGESISRSVREYYDSMTTKDRAAYSDLRKRAWETRRNREAQGVAA